MNLKQKKPSVQINFGYKFNSNQNFDNTSSNFHTKKNSVDNSYFDDK